VGAPDGVRRVSCRVCHEHDEPSAFPVANSHLTSTIRESSPTPTPAFLGGFVPMLVLDGCGGLFGIGTIAKSARSEMIIDDGAQQRQR